MPVGLLQNNIDEVTKKYHLPNNHKITKTLKSQIIVTAKYYVPYGKGNGSPYLLFKIEDEFCNLIIAMSKFHHPIRFFNTLQLINDYITNMFVTILSQPS